MSRNNIRSTCYTTKDVIYLYEQLCDILGNKTINTENIVKVLTELMKCVDNYPHLCGEAKKELVIRVIKRVVENNVIEEDNLLAVFVDIFIPSIIDSLMLVEKRDIIIKSRKKQKFCFFPFCFI
jgi:hypothetical protein